MFMYQYVCAERKNGTFYVKRFIGSASIYLTIKDYWNNRHLAKYNYNSIKKDFDGVCLLDELMYLDGDSDGVIVIPYKKKCFLWLKDYLKLKK